MVYVFGEFELDTDFYELRRDGAACSLEPQVFDVLAYLFAHSDRVVPKEEILDVLWGTNYVSDAALSSRVMAARRAVGDNGTQQSVIRTVRGRGFRFVAKVTQRAGEKSAPDTKARTTSSSPAARAGKTRRSQTIGFCTTADGVRLAYARVGQWSGHRQVA